MPVLGRDVRYVETEGGVVLLDFRTQSYSVLDPVASSMWLLAVSGCRDDDAVAALERRYEADRDRLGRDYAAFLRMCSEQGLLIDSAADGETLETRPPAPVLRNESAPRWLTLRAWMSLFRVSRLLRRAGFSRAYRQIGRQAVRDSSSEPVPLEQALKGFARAENFWLLKRAPDDCLPRSLSLFVFLRSLGLPVEHRIGVQRVPFAAHAWVQLGDRVLLDDARNPSRFARIAGLPE